MYRVLVLFQYNTRGQIATWSTCCFSNSHKVFYQLPLTGKFLRVKKPPHVLVSSAKSGETPLN